MAMKQQRALETNVAMKMRVERLYDPAVFSASEIIINRALDVLEVWFDRYMVTPLLGRDQSAATA
jgi:hypothetical protein